MKTEPPAKWVLPPSGYQSPGDDTGLRLSLVFYLLHSLNSNFAQVLEILEAFFFFLYQKKTGKVTLALEVLVTNQALSHCGKTLFHKKWRG